MRVSLKISTTAFAVTLLVVMLSVQGRPAQGGEFPQPTGDYAVGMTRFAFTDSTRPELFTEDPDDRREITVTVWYPGELIEGAPRAPYYPMADEIVKRFPYPDSLADIQTSSRVDLPVAGAGERYPVVIFNHGWGEQVGQSTVLMQELASHGYVVFSIAHHHEAKFWVYPDGRVVFLDTMNPRFQQIIAEQSQPGMMDLYNAMFTARGVEEQKAVFRESMDKMPTMLVETPRMWAGDIGFVIDELDSLNRGKDTGSGLFSGRLDLEKVAVAGMSMGGIAAGQACIDDSRIRACINIDGGLFGDLLDSTLSVPVMFMGSKRFVGYEDVFAGSSDGDVYTVIVGDSDHYDYTDFTLIHRQHVLMGSVDGHRMLELVNAYTLAFLERYLRGSEQDLLKTGPSPYPEVEFREFIAK